MLAIKRALISVSDKAGLEPFVKGLNSLGIEIISTGGTARFISSLGIKVRSVEEMTGFPEMMDGRVKTLHPKIHAALLAVRDNPQHMRQLKEQGIEPIDMVVINLYPFQKVISKTNTKLEEAIENIDIGGPSMLRSAAKNYKSVAVVTSPAQYDNILNELNKNNGTISDKTLKYLAIEVFRQTSEYDGCIHNYLQSALEGPPQETAASLFPKDLNLKFEKIQDLRYGENAHQEAAFYKTASGRESSIAGARQLSGKELSYNNIMDMDAALEAVKEFDEPAACIIKHATPCGIATAETLTKAYQDAFECDKLSAFGGIIGLNRNVDVNTAEAMLNSGFLECVIATGYEPNALKRLMAKQNLRLLSVEPLSNVRDKEELHIRNVTGGILIQEKDLKDMDHTQLKIVTQRKPTPQEVEALIFAWKAVKHVKSNAIVLAQGTKTIGIGAGQTSRVDSVIIAVRKAGEKTKGAVLASEAFFPKEDSIEIAADSGITAIIQPGGSKQDDTVIELANKKNLAMVFTGIRHFRH